MGKDCHLASSNTVIPPWSTVFKTNLQEIRSPDQWRHIRCLVKRRLAMETTQEITLVACCDRAKSPTGRISGKGRATCSCRGGYIAHYQQADCGWSNEWEAFAGSSPRPRAGRRTVDGEARIASEPSIRRSRFHIDEPPRRAC